MLDGAAAVFLALVQFITGLVMRFSRFYLHREPGFRRFFATVLLFHGAMCLLALAGNLDLMFAGWELVGISSFLLIAFYRERQSAVRNALKTYSVYRVADIGMLLAACLKGAGSSRYLPRPVRAAGGDGQVGAVPVQLLGGARDGRPDPVERAVLRRAVGARGRISAAAHVPSVRAASCGPHLHRR